MTPKQWLFTVSLCAAGLLAAGEAFAANPARIDIFADSELGFQRQDGVKWSYGNWQKPENVKKYLVADLPPASDWKEISLTFTAQADGRAKVMLLGPCVSGGKNTSVQPLGVYYDDIKLNGVLIPNGDFEAGSKGFGFWCYEKDKSYQGRIVEDPEIAKSGNKCALAWHNGQIIFGIDVKKGQPATLSFFYRDAGEFQPLANGK